MDAKTQQLLKDLPAVDEVVRTLDAQDAAAAPRWALVQAARDEVDALRARIVAGEADDAELDPEQVRRRVATLLAPSLRPVFNATGVVVHTNLGRAPLSAAVLQRVVQVAAGYSNLEYDLDARHRGSRHSHAAAILCQLTGAEDAVVVNNNAAAVLLCLAALAKDREVIVSRGELIEIGGSFRLPDVMAASGAILREVGATNRTHPRDYVGAINEQTALLLKCHQSNFAMVGFTREVEPEQLCAMGREHGLPTMFDLGSGSLLELQRLGLPAETTVQQAVGQGFDLVTFSGDKLLGGPQAGIIVGRAQAVARLRSHPLMRPLRPDKLTLAGLLATLEAYRDGTAQDELAVPAMLSCPLDRLKRRATRLRDRLREACGEPWRFGLMQVESRVGGGAQPTARLPSWAVTMEHPEQGPDGLEALLRTADPPVVARIEQHALLLDVRTVADAELTAMARAVTLALGCRR